MGLCRGSVSGHGFPSSAVLISLVDDGEPILLLSKHLFPSSNGFSHKPLLFVWSLEAFAPPTIGRFSFS